MAYVSIRGCVDYIKNYEDFRGSSMHGEMVNDTHCHFTHDYFPNMHKFYRVYSYRQCMFEKDLTSGRVFYDSRFWSMTTRKHQGAIVNALYWTDLNGFRTKWIGRRGGKHRFFAIGIRERNGEWQYACKVYSN